MRVLILGGGGLGATLAAFLARAGADVTLFVRPAHAAAVATAQVRVEGLVEFVAPATYASDAAMLGAFDYLVVCVKTRDTEAVLAAVAGVRVGAVLSLQNGVGKDELLVRCFSRERVLGALSMVGGTLVRPGVVRHTLAGPTLVGELDGGCAPRAERLAEAIRAGGLPAECVPEVVAREWQKLATFLPGALVCTLARTDMATSLLDEALLRVRRSLAREIAAVAAAEGSPLDALPVFLTAKSAADLGLPAQATFADADDAVAATYRAVGADLQRQGVPVYPSMTGDFAAGRPSEIEDTAGDVLLRADRHDLAAPVLVTCTDLLRGMEAHLLERGKAG